MEGRTAWAVPSRRALKRRADVGARAEMAGDGVHSMRKQKRRKGALGVFGSVTALAEKDGVRVKSAAMVEDSDSG